MDSWRFRKKHGTCTACERSFSDGERHVSLLAVAGEELTRKDLCDPCWEVHARSADDLFWWFTRFEIGRKRTLSLDLASLERLFIELEGREGEKLAELRYLVCLLLMRKRKLKLASVRRDQDGEFLVVRRPRRKEALPVAVHDFQPEQLEEVSARLSSILDGSGESDGLSAHESCDERLGAMDENAARDPEERGQEGSESPQPSMPDDAEGRDGVGTGQGGDSLSLGEGGKCAPREEPKKPSPARKRDA